MPSGPPMRADARRNREAIIAAARAVFNAGEKIRFDDFAARAGVGVGTLYRHFPTREALAAEVYGDEVRAICDRARRSERPPGERLDEFLRAFVDHVVDHAALARALGAVVDDATQADGGAALERTLADLMGAAAGDGAIRDDVPPGAVLIMLHSIGSAIERPEWASEARSLVATVIRGLQRR